MKHFKCHKEVDAFKISKITAQALGTEAGEPVPAEMVAVPYESGIAYEPAAQKTEYLLESVEGDRLAVSEDFYVNHGVHTGGYFVRYANGHESFSPADAFESGYTEHTKRRVLHVRLGSKNWMPTIEDMQAVMDMFLSAKVDPLGGVVCTNPYIDCSIELVDGDDQSEIVVINAQNKKQIKSTLKQRDSEIRWHTMHVWPADSLLPESTTDETHLHNAKQGARYARGRSVNRIVLHGLKFNDVQYDVFTALNCAVMTWELKSGERVMWEEQE